MVIIGIIGKKNSGKSTISKYLSEKYNFLEKSFADPLKKICQYIFLLSDEQLSDFNLKEKPDERWYNCSPRKMFQFIGTELLRDNLEKIMPGIGKDIFIKHLEFWYKEYIKNNENINIVISDIRFYNEYLFIKENNGIIIKVIRENNFLSDTHISENELENYNINIDYLINNNETKTELLLNIDEIINKIFFNK